MLRRYGVGLLVVVAVVVVGAAVFDLANRSGSIPGKVAREAKTPLYETTKLPDGYAVARDTFQQRGDITTFQIKGRDDRLVTVSQQPRPEGFDTARFNPDKKVDTESGQLLLSKNDEFSTATMVTEKTLVLMGSMGDVSLDELEAIARSLKKL